MTRSNGLKRNNSRRNAIHTFALYLRPHLRYSFRAFVISLIIIRPKLKKKELRIHADATDCYGLSASIRRNSENPRFLPSTCRLT
jgi:hypothetical protein